MKLYSLLSLLIAAMLSTVSIAKQTTFTSSEKASESLHKALSKRDHTAITQLFGKPYSKILPLKKLSDDKIEFFLTAWKASHRIISNNKQQFYIEVGNNLWTFPVPLIKTKDGWIFDSITGIENIIIRRLGRNELATIQTVLAYHDAQLEYAEKDRNGNKILEYAQKFKSTKGKKDGLYWEVKPGEKPSPLGTLVANKTTETAHNGYFYKILTAQGNAAKGGAHSYIQDNKMTKGFALIAWPAKYGSSGVISFMISHSGIVYEKNLGPIPDQEINKTDINSFNPDDSWHVLKKIKED